MSFASPVELKKRILGFDSSDFVSEYIFEPIPFLFNSDLSLWINWKRVLASKLEVDPYDIVLTGSAAIGYSLNPWKNFKAFDERSDVDVGVISAHHFELAWRHLRHLRNTVLKPDVRYHLAEHKKRHIFSGTIAGDKILAFLPFALEWQSGLDAMSKIDPTVGRTVNLRIYKDYDSLRFYQRSNLESLQLRLQENEGIETINKLET